MTDYNTDRGVWTGPSPNEIRQRVEAAGPTDAMWSRLRTLRAELFQAIAESLASDGHCKSYEGALLVHLPNYFEEQAAHDNFGRLGTGGWTIELHCYLIGPNRHYRWEGHSFDECLSKAELDIRAWIVGNYTVRHDEQL